MDLSGIIFVVLAVAWAVYLIPKALKHHDEMARTRSVDRFSHTMRVLTRKNAPVAAPVAEPTPVTEPLAPVSRGPRPVLTRAKAREAAARRRRVLALLTVVLVAVAAAAYLKYVPWAAVAAPGVLIVTFLVIARLTVRGQSAKRVAAPRAAAPLAVEVLPTEHDIEPELDTEDTIGISREALAAAIADPVADEGSLWDPLPVTLPTYVSKARARRTVRTIELTQTGVTSSGRSEADSELVRQSEAATAANAETVEEAEHRKAAGA